MYKIGMVLTGFVLWVLIIASGMFYMMEGLTKRTSILILLVALMVACMVMMVRFKSSKDQAGQSLSLFDTDIDAEYDSADRDQTEVLMMYKGRPYDFVNNDPTAPDLL